MFVKDIMTKNPVSVPLDYPISKAYKLINEKGFSQLPVVDKDNKLVGLITESSLEEVSPSSNLSDYEINYLLNQTKLRDIMQTGIFVIMEDTIIENAALIIKENRISSICVIDKDKRLCGIITKTDVLKALIDTMSIRSSGTRFYMITNKGKNIFKELSDYFANENISILNLCVTENKESFEVSIKLGSSNITENVTDKLNQMGYKILSTKIRV